MMKKLTALFLALALLCSLAGCGKQQSGRPLEDDSPSSEVRPEPPRAPGVSDEEEPEDEPEDAANAEQTIDFLGSWNGNVYSNEFLGLCYTLPDSWVYASDEELLEMVDIAVSNDILSDEVKLSAELGKSRMVYGMAAQDPVGGSSVQVMFMNLEGLGEVSEEECARQITEMQESILDESSGITLTVEDSYRAPLGGKNFLVVPIKLNMSGVTARQQIYIQLSGNYGMMIYITALADRDIETMEGGAASFAPLNGAGESGTSGALTAIGDIGRTFDTMFFDYTVVSAESPAEYDGYTAASGNKLLVVGVKVKNDFGSTLPMYDTDFQIQWGPGDYDYAWAVDAFNDKMMPLEWELANGKEVTYDMLFEVPAGQNDFSLVYLEEYTDRFGEDQVGDLYSADFTLLAAAGA